MPCVRDMAHHDAAGGQQCDLRHSSRWGSGPIVSRLARVDPGEPGLSHSDQVFWRF
jgi:hypothetical protein